MLLQLRHITLYERSLRPIHAGLSVCKIQQIWDPLEVDMFASRLTSQLQIQSESQLETKSGCRSSKPCMQHWGNIPFCMDCYAMHADLRQRAHSETHVSSVSITGYPNDCKFINSNHPLLHFHLIKFVHFRSSHADFAPWVVARKVFLARWHISKRTCMHRLMRRLTTLPYS